MKSDIEIAQEATMQPITKIASKLGLTEDEIDLYGKVKAKILKSDIHEANNYGKLILVTSMNPTPAGEGKSTVTIGLGDALSSIQKKTAIALREPSLGPTLGLKGGATGGGYAQVVPMEEINLHFTGDMHALTSATNLLSAIIDNHIHQGNELNIDIKRILWKRAVDLNDRALRTIEIGLGGPVNGVPREDGFEITVATEMMAVLCLARDLNDLQKRVSNILVAYDISGNPIRVSDLKVEGAITALLKEAIKPNLVQTLEGTPAIVHGGPFANIAHGCNSVMATKMALTLADYTVTEAGFGADLGAQKFLDIKVPVLGKSPDAIVLVATIRSTKMHGGLSLEELSNGESLDALREGFKNVAKHIENVQQYGIPMVVALNEFTTDTLAERELFMELCESIGVDCVLSSVWEKGSEGGIQLAEKVVELCEQKSQFNALYPVDATIQEKIDAVATKIYGASKVNYTENSLEDLKEIERMGWNEMNICIAKTPYSFSDNAKLKGRPNNFEITIRSLVPKLGAGFIVALTGKVLTMPGLPKVPAALGITVSEDGKIQGLY
ncbi:formate--tetrahydrofolate ligase [Granulicatella adiacens ATCC 49175]|uniref:Formate--tetrahydrofolate ligase n=1 Tax=Granulicatella adiacens ATCC 49175 TaxID=638301 RepID=C8NE90_9LACT|nr:formate--tetrahydrofolate ligase [Granulicatella adiacens]EEW37991.1 formate--tetrahydrofolate ligase [Granulicatella adiacens ATCC 49175]UAK93877.1 formate--tetrahydrofolate ligase [Granulicatella adiacens]UWP38888.1 formate--tetrahydrofolate ligase [Granulicatella adiacens ATCC 49175]